MADSDNILENLVGSIILQIKPYQPPQVSGNGKETHEITTRVEAKAPVAKKNFLPMFLSKWKRRNGNGEAAVQVKTAAMKK